MIKKALFVILMLSACQNHSIQTMPNQPDFIDVKRGKGETVMVIFDNNKETLLAEIQKHQGHLVRDDSNFNRLVVSLPLNFEEIKKRLETINGVRVIKNPPHLLHN